MNKVIQVALQEVGYLEKKDNSNLDSKTANAGYNNWTKYARDLDKLGVYNFAKNGFDWCDIFVDWCFVQAYGLNNMVKMLYQPLKGLGAGCTYSMGYYRDNNALFSTPEAGDQCFFSRDGWKTSYHTGLVEKVEGGRIYTVEGNTSNASGVIANGGGVARKSYPTSMAMYGRPNYSIVEEEVNNMDQAKFNEMFKVAMAAYRAELQDNDYGAWSEPGRQFVINNGIMAGSSPLPDGSPNYMWQDLITREQVAVVLYRMAVQFGLV